jgi:hypothetical protein
MPDMVKLRLLPAVLVPVAVVSIVTLIWMRPGAAAGRAPGTTDSRVATVALSRQDLATTSSHPGHLGYGTPRVVKASRSGILTWLPAPGTSVRRGRTLYRVDDTPVPLFYGRLPLFRPLSEPGTAGRDVRMVVENLEALGYSVGHRYAAGDRVLSPAGPADRTAPTDEADTTDKTDKAGEATGTGSADPVDGTDGDASRRPLVPGVRSTAAAGTGPGPPAAGKPVWVTVRPGEDVLTPSLMKAVEHWQQDVGMPVSGTLAVGDVAVLGGPVRVGAISAVVGDDVPAPVMSVTATTKVVTVDLDQDEAVSVRPGRRVVVRLPDENTVVGHVSTVASELRDDADDGAPATLTVTVDLGEPRTVARLDAAPVQVDFPGVKHAQVLTAPVGALLALAEGGYAVQVAGAGLVKVRTGLFAGGMVEIDGPGLSETTRVVTTS